MPMSCIRAKFCIRTKMGPNWADTEAKFTAESDTAKECTCGEGQRLRENSKTTG